MTETVIERRPQGITAQERLQSMAHDVLHDRMTFDELIEELRSDAELLIALLSMAEPELRERAYGYLRKYKNDLKYGGQFPYAVQGQNPAAPSQTGEAVHASRAQTGQSPADRLARTIVRSHERKIPETGQVPLADKATTAVPAREPSQAALAASLAARKSAAKAVLMLIDGRDIRLWTIGQCLTGARHKARESRILKTLGEQYQHLPHHKEIGELASDKQIKEIIKTA
jgi:hypothetical protein